MTKLASVFRLRLPNSLRAAVARMCREDGTSINQFVTTAVAEKISAMQTVDSDIDAARRLLLRDGGQQPQPHDRLDVNPGPLCILDSGPASSP